MHVAIIGAGWAGLAAAVELCHRGHQVTVIEAASQAGGRARGVDSGDIRIDNGQHLLIGAYHQTRMLLERIGLRDDQVFDRRRLRLLMYLLQENRSIDLHVARLPAPLHMLAALLMARGLTVTERWLALRFCAAVPGLRRAASNDLTVASLLQRYRQSERLVTALWEPLCLAIMNTPTQQASASVFIRVLGDAFLRRRDDSDLLIPIRDLGAVIPEPAIDYIRQHGGQVHLGKRITTLHVADKRVTAAVCKDGSPIEADHFIIATAPPACQRLVAPHELFASLNNQLTRFDYAPICTVYLHYPIDVRSDPPMTGLVGGLGQWLFDRRLCGQPGLMAVVISGHGEHEQMDNADLTRRVSAELATLHPHWPPSLRSLVLREKRATFVCDPASDRNRPAHATAAHNTWLAGDYTATGYPATLEGAIHSGRACASLLLNKADSGRAD